MRCIDSGYSIGAGDRPRKTVDLLPCREIVGVGRLDIIRPAKFSDKAEDIPLLGSCFLNFLPFRFILKLFRFFQILLVILIANKIHTLEVSLLSTSFDISVLLGDDETEKIGSFCVTGR